MRRVMKIGNEDNPVILKFEYNSQDEIDIFQIFQDIIVEQGYPVTTYMPDENGKSTLSVRG